MFKKFVFLIVSLLAIGLPLTVYGSEAEQNGQLQTTYSAINTQTIPSTYQNTQVFGNITITNPDSGETYLPGSVIPIRWDYNGYAGQNVKISLYRGTTLVKTLASSVPIGANGHGIFNWSIPPEIHQSTNYIIEVKSLERNDVKGASAYFNITGKLNITEPSGNGVAWSIGATKTIRWTYKDIDSRNIRLMLLRNGTAVSEIKMSMPVASGGTGAYDWTIPVTCAPGDNYAIQIMTLSAPIIKTISSPFEIKRSIKLTHPIINPSGNSPVTVKGEAYGCSSVKLTLFGRKSGYGGIPAWGEISTITVPVVDRHFSHSYTLNHSRYTVAASSDVDPSVNDSLNFEVQ